VRPTLPVLFMTGYAHNAAIDICGAVAQGMDVLTKPFTLDTLVTKIQGLVGSE
jgi:hypothetical protein